MTRKPIITPPILEIIRRLASQGKTSVEISAVVGAAPDTIRQVCSKHKIRLALGRPRSLKVNVVVPANIHAIYEEVAINTYKINVKRLMGAVVNIVARHGLFDAVLGELEGSDAELLKPRPQRYHKPYRKRAAPESYQGPRNDTGNGAAVAADLEQASGDGSSLIGEDHGQ